MDCSLSVVVPFQNELQAKAAYDALFPDPEVKPQEFSKKLTVDGTKLSANFEAATNRSLRVGVNGFMDTLALTIECIDAFELPAPKSSS